MNFHLQFQIPPFENKISYSHKMLFIGSCFAENVAEKMQKYKFDVNINPHGVLYNPASIAVALRSYVFNWQTDESELFYADELWNSWQHHSRFSNPDKAACLKQINERISAAHDFIKKAEWLFITFGSAFTYTHIAENKAVANCHKMPQKEFTKSLQSVTEIVHEYNALLAELKKINPSLIIVFTVSPVRYVRDGIVENNVSKGILLQAVHELTKNNSAIYFPAYELVIDDLRDYRFYNSDLVHPNEQAIDYVFEKLKAAAFDESAHQLLEKIKELIAAKQHRPFNEDTEQHKKFKAAYLERCKRLQNEFPFLDLVEELNYFQS